MKDLNSYPSELTESRLALEGSFVFSLWGDPETYGDYLHINDKKNKVLLTDDGVFYYTLGKNLYEQGYRNFDNVTLTTYLKDYPETKNYYEDRGGYKSVSEMMSVTSSENTSGYFDGLIKLNTLMILHDKGFNVLKNINKLKKMTNQEVYDFYDYQLNSIAIESGHDFEIENLLIDDKFLKTCDEGEANGISYGKVCKIMNNITMGLPLGELFMLGGYSGVGKSSFVFENMIIPISEDGIKCTVISNEQRSKDFKYLLLSHVLTQDLDYWGITRKRLKQGHFTAEQKEKLIEAKKIIENKYSEIRFVKLFDNNMDKVKKVIKKLSKLGHQVFMFDTMKSEDALDEAMWQQLLLHSRKLFQLASRENISIVCTYQLALHTTNRRYLDASCLSNSKQIKEVFSEMVYFRQIWDDELKGQKYYIHPVQLKKDSQGKYSIKEEQSLDVENKRYVIAFIDKTRNDEDKQQILFEFNGRYNKWREVGYCHVMNDHSW